MSKYVIRLKAPFNVIHKQQYTDNNCVEIVEDNFGIIRFSATEKEAIDTYIPKTNDVIPLACWLSKPNKVKKQLENVGVWLAPEDDPYLLSDLISNNGIATPATIAIDFPTWKDGRGYSHAYIIRQRLNWTGELRAVGDVLRDQIKFMARSGITVFAPNNCKEEVLMDALKAFSEFKLHYQGDNWQPKPYFHSRNNIKSANIN